jgi:hypothetical protein
VDLVVATDTPHVASGSHSPHASPQAPGLKRIWDQERGVHLDSSAEIEENDRRFNDSRFVVNVTEDDKEDIREEEPTVLQVHDAAEVVRAETPPSYARTWKYDGIGSPEEDEQNPWS